MQLSRFDFSKEIGETLSLCTYEPLSRLIVFAKFRIKDNEEGKRNGKAKKRKGKKRKKERKKERKRKRKEQERQRHGKEKERVWGHFSNK